MAIVLTKQEALEELVYLKETWKKPPFPFPAFCHELEYVDFFIYLLKSLRDAGSNDIVPFVTNHFERGLDGAFAEICRVLDQHRAFADGAGIYNLMCERQFIIRKEKRAYNRKVPGKCPKGLKNDEWNSYNNWLASAVMWSGFLEAHERDYKVYIDWEDIETPIQVLLCPDYKPLWGMKQAYDKAGRPYHGGDLDSVNLWPIGFWVQYLKQLKTA